MANLSFGSAVLASEMPVPKVKGYVATDEVDEVVTMATRQRL